MAAAIVSYGWSNVRSPRSYATMNAGGTLDVSGTGWSWLAAPSSFAAEVGAVASCSLVAMNRDLDATTTPFPNVGISRASISARAMLAILALQSRQKNLPLFWSVAGRQFATLVAFS